MRVAWISTQDGSTTTEIPRLETAGRNKFATYRRNRFQRLISKREYRHLFYKFEAAR